MKTQVAFPDLTQRPPRSFRVRLGNYVILARMLDKGRATLAKKNSEYNYNSGTDQHLVRFLGFDPKALLKELATGKGDGEILAWIQKTAKNKRTDAEIFAWSAYHDHRPPSGVEGREYFHSLHVKIAPKREDISSWFEVLDLDDYVSYGGKA